MSLIPKLQELLRKEYQKPRTVGHVSDIVLCPRETYYRHTNPQPINKFELSHFFVGQSYHVAIQVLAKNDPDRYVAEEPVKGDGGFIEAHIDLYDKIDNICYEIKTIRKGTVLANLTDEIIRNDKEFNINQLKMYMALKGAAFGIILYVMIQDYNEPFKEFPVTMTSEERADMLQYMESEMAALQYAIDTKDAAKARHIAYDPKLNWKCLYCKYKTECKLVNAIEERNNKDIIPMIKTTKK